MTPKTVNLVLNQQQLELLDNTVARGVASDRQALVRTALREFSDRYGPTSAKVNTKQNG